MSESCPDRPASQAGASSDASAGQTEDAAPASEDPLSSRPGGRSGFRVFLNLEVNDTAPPLVGWLDVQFERIAALAGVDEGEVAITVVDDGIMSDLHGQYKDDATPTDVLTFDLRESPDGPIEADLVICLDEARRQAEARSHDTRLESLLYAVHGLMHLLGENDDTEEAAAEMHAREDHLLTEAGLGAVFAREEATGKT